MLRSYGPAGGGQPSRPEAPGPDGHQVDRQTARNFAWVALSLKYLSEHVDEVIAAIRHSGDILCKDDASWETTAWTRSMADAVKLAEALREAVFAEVDQVEACTDACVGLVRASGPRPPIRWGVRVRLVRE